MSAQSSENWRVTPIPEWRDAWQFASVRLAIGAGLFGMLPADQQEALLALVGLGPERLPLVLGGLFIVARVLQKAET